MANNGYTFHHNPRKIAEGLRALADQVDRIGEVTGHGDELPAALWCSVSIQVAQHSAPADVRTQLVDDVATALQIPVADADARHHSTGQHGFCGLALVVHTSGSGGS